LPRELGRAGLGVLVLEARDRVGGRTWTDRRLGHDLELGGTWVHWVQPHTWAEMTRYGREITRSPPAGEAYWPGAGGAPRAGTLDEFMALIDAGQQAIVDDVRAAIPRGTDPAAGQIGALDALSIQDRLDAVGLDDEARSANEAVRAGHVNARLDQAGLSSALRWAAAAGGHRQLMHEASATYRVAGGMSGFTQAIAADVAGQIRLGATVRRVAQTADGAVVTRAGGTGARARRVISTLPVNAIAGIEWEPGLPGPAVRRVREPAASDLRAEDRVHRRRRDGPGRVRPRPHPARRDQRRRRAGRGRRAAFRAGGHRGSRARYARRQQVRRPDARSQVLPRHLGRRHGHTRARA
jgi:monoamine oxidase